ncbi:undecaprenyl-diphosphatase UppP, partial [bacterium]
MNLFQALVYGLVQGLTEFLPVSSSAHLRLVPELFGWPDAGAAFTAVIQLGTIAAVILYFRRDLVAAAKGWARSLSTRDLSPVEARIGWGVLVGTVPIVVLALLFKHQIEGPLRSLWVVATAFIVMGVVMLLAERYGNKARTEGSVTVKDGAIIGLWQALALIPGMSRSGSTISGALFANFDRPTAARFSFLLSIPSITAAGLYEAFKERKGLGGELLMPTLVATIVSFVVGYAAISWLIPFVATSVGISNSPPSPLRSLNA